MTRDFIGFYENGPYVIGEWALPVSFLGYTTGRHPDQG